MHSNSYAACHICAAVCYSATGCRQQFRGGKNAQQVAEALVDIALKRYTTDNVGVVVADLKGPEGWQKKTVKGKGGGRLFGGLFGGSK
jgi:serine/threonine protein phosphatase PrpC